MPSENTNITQHLPANNQIKIDVYIEEYKIASTRYENIYKAIWQNFSYMSVVAGGLLTFGNNFFTEKNNVGNKYLVAFLACVPLLFWYISTFVPMNEYGYKAADELAEIEEKINNILDGGEMNHFTDFKNRRRRFWDIFTKPSVRSMMLIFFVVIMFIAVFNYINAFNLIPTLESQEYVILVIIGIFLIASWGLPILWNKYKQNLLPKLKLEWFVNNSNEGIGVRKQGIQTLFILFIIVLGGGVYQYFINFINKNALWSLWLLGAFLVASIWIGLLETQRIFKRATANAPTTNTNENTDESNVAIEAESEN